MDVPPGTRRWLPTLDRTSMRDAFFESGFVITRPLLPPEECDSVGEAVRASVDAKVGPRSLLSLYWVQALARRLRADPAIAELVSPDAACTQCTLFAKSSAQNWLVPLHQDLSIPITARVNSSEVAGWSRKEGVLYAQPPASVLATLVAVRLQLDPLAPSDGALRVVPQSHARGRLSDPDIIALRAEFGEVICSVPRGAALVMRPLLLHASSKLSAGALRRVLHFVFGPRELPLGLRWAYAV